MDLESSFHHLVIHKYYVLGYTVMLLYDHLLTLDSEVNLIWCRRFTLPTYLFFIFRYMTPLVCIINLVAEHDPTWMGSRCSHWIWFPVAIGPIISGTTGIILILRTYALYTRASWILCIAVPVYMAQIGVMAWSIPGGVPAQLPPGFIGCIASEKTGTKNRLQGSYIAALVFDACIFLLTFARALHLRLLSARVPLVTLMLRDGLMYFIALALVHLVNVNVLALAPGTLGDMNARFSNLMTATLVSRLMLNLRAASARIRVHVHASTASTAGLPITTFADVGNWISAHEIVLGVSEFDAPLGEGYEDIPSSTGSSWTVCPQAAAYERGRNLDIELQDIEHGRSSPRSAPLENG